MNENKMKLIEEMKCPCCGETEKTIETTTIASRECVDKIISNLSSTWPSSDQRKYIKEVTCKNCGHISFFYQSILERK